MATFLIPASLKPFTAQEESIQVSGQSLKSCLDELIAKYPALKPYIFDEDEEINHFINIYVNDEDVRYLQATQTPIQAEDVISILPSIAGG